MVRFRNWLKDPLSRFWIALAISAVVALIGLSLPIVILFQVGLIASVSLLAVAMLSGV